MTVIDASVWVSAARTIEPAYRTSTAWARAHTAAGRLLFVPAIFSAEVAGALVRRNEPSRLIDELVHDIHYGPFFRMISVDSELGWNSAKVSSDFRIRGADAIYVALAHLLNLPLVTWDNEQLERAGQIIEVMTPAQALERMA